MEDPPEEEPLEGVRMNKCLARWRRAHDEAMADAACYRLAVPWDDEAVVRPAVVRLLPGSRQRAGDGTTVPLEFLFPEAPEELDMHRFAQAFAGVLHAWLQEQRCAEFRDRLAERQESTLRRSLEQLESGDQTEEGWREYLRRPLLEDVAPPRAVALVLNPKYRAFRVLVCRVALPPAAAEHVGLLCFRHIFDDEATDKGGGRCIMTCLYVLVIMFAILLVLVLGVLLRGLLKI
mmetsp:Transcript_49446/g.152546  ORF Transcript_49446/g.152546 Transcript_49446/m.152546 type:complete len:234 (-) Transcript_49446:56-757(-)